MTDLEITRLCAEAMELEISWTDPFTSGMLRLPTGWTTYDPLHDDAQAMALVKKIRLYIAPEYPHGWDVGPENTLGKSVINADLNRAICECVAQIQQEQKTA